MNKNRKNIFKEKLDKKQFVITTEISPPKGTDYNLRLKKIENLKGRVDAINVTDQQSSVMRLGSLAMSHFLLEAGYEPIYQITCRDRNRIALESDILSASSLEIKNILVLTGDYPTAGDHPEAKPVFDLDSVQLLEVIKKMHEGFDMVDNELKGKPEFLTGAVTNPGVSPIEPEIIKMEKKIEAGSRFFQTQAVYDINKLKKFLNLTSHIEIPIIVGIIPLRSVSMANYINRNLAGVSIPEEYMKKLSKANEIKQESINLTVEFIQNIRKFVAGVHIMPINWPGVVDKILDRLGR